MQIVSQDKRTVIEYKGVSVQMDDKGYSGIICLTEKGGGKLMAVYDSYEKALRIINEIAHQAADGRQIYCLPE